MLDGAVFRGSQSQVLIAAGLLLTSWATWGTPSTPSHSEMSFHLSQAVIIMPFHRS